jgi:hypothetical protein
MELGPGQQDIAENMGRSVGKFDRQ